MNGKKAKALRKKQYNLVIQYVKDRLLTPEQWEGQPEDRMFYAVPNTYFTHLGNTKCSILSRRWWYKQVKKNPEVSYEEILESAGIKSN